MLLRGPVKAREAERHFGKAPGVPNSDLAAGHALGIGTANEEMLRELNHQIQDLYTVYTWKNQDLNPRKAMDFPYL